MKSILKPLNQSGVAILMAITTVAIIAFLAVELAYDTASEYLISAQEIQRLKARYAAKAGVEISLLRIHIYRQAMEQLGSQLGEQKALLDKVWTTPFFWPLVLPQEASRIDQEQMQEILKDSFMDASFQATIESESSKIDLTDLVSPSKGLAKIAKQNLIRMIENKKNNDEEWLDTHRDLNAEEIVNNIIDWQDKDSVSLNGGDESSNYSSRNADVQLPPNQPFKTIDELHMVTGMTDSLYDFLSPQVTLYGAKGVQVNHASENILMSLDSTISPDIAKAIREKIQGPDGPFNDKQQFFSFLQSQGITSQGIEDSGVPLLFDVEYNFKIRSHGQYGRSSSDIIAIVYDFDKVKERLVDALINEQTQNSSAGAQQGQGDTTAQEGQQGSTASGGTANNDNSKPPEEKKKNSKPQVVYWFEI